jgi:putative transposase
MDKRAKLPRRRQIRLLKYDYGQPGCYFVTICTQQRICQFGNVIGEEMILNDAGQMVQQVWKDIANRFSNVMLDSYQIMPNHIHGIIVITQADADDPPVDTYVKAHRVNLSGIIGQFKSITTALYITGVHQHDWPKFPRKLWQRGFHDHIIRNDKELDRIREYIENNPIQWAFDRENPDKS